MGTFGFSDFEYPQTVQHFILAAFPVSFFIFFITFAICLCTIGVIKFFLSVKKELSNDVSKLSRFLKMDEKKIIRQARFAALPKQLFFWSIFAPIIFIIVLSLEAAFGVSGLGSTIKIAILHKDNQLLYGCCLCSFGFVLAGEFICLFLGWIFRLKKI